MGRGKPAPKSRRARLHSEFVDDAEGGAGVGVDDDEGGVLQALPEGGGAGVEVGRGVEGYDCAVGDDAEGAVRVGSKDGVDGLGEAGAGFVG